MWVTEWCLISEIPLHLMLQKLLADKCAWGWTEYISTGTRVKPCSLTRNTPWESNFYSFTWFIQLLFWNARISVGHRFRHKVMPVRVLSVVVQLLNRVRLFATPRTAACQIPLSYAVSWSLLKLMSIESVKPSNHLILCYPPSPPAFNFSSISRLDWWVCSWNQVAKVLELQLQHQSFQWIFRVYFLLDWLVWSPFCPRDSQESSPATQFEDPMAKHSIVFRPLITESWPQAATLQMSCWQTH